jgi:hypothetical protein
MKRLKMMVLAALVLTVAVAFAATRGSQSFVPTVAPSEGGNKP